MATYFHIKDWYQQTGAQGLLQYIEDPKKVGNSGGRAAARMALEVAVDFDDAQLFQELVQKYSFSPNLLQYQYESIIQDGRKNIFTWLLEDHQWNINKNFKNTLAHIIFDLQYDLVDLCLTDPNCIIDDNAIATAHDQEDFEIEQKLKYWQNIDPHIRAKQIGNKLKIQSEETGLSQLGFFENSANLITRFSNFTS